MHGQTSGRLKLLGMILFLLGLITGLVMSNFTNPRMGLAAHLEGLLNGIFLLVAGLIWKDLKIKEVFKRITLGTLVYGTYGNWFITLLAACLGTSIRTPIAGAGFSGTVLENQIVNVGFITVGVTMLFSLVVFIIGLAGSPADK